MVAETSKNISVTIRVWRQPATDQPGKFVDYPAKDLNPNMSLLEMLDVVNDQLERIGEETRAHVGSRVTERRTRKRNRTRCPTEKRELRNIRRRACVRRLRMAQDDLRREATLAECQLTDSNIVQRAEAIDGNEHNGRGLERSRNVEVRARRADG